MEHYLLTDLNIAENIVRLRRSAKMTQKYVTIQLEIMGLNISRSSLSMIELGRLNVPVSMLVALKILFKCDFNDFFVGLEQHFDFL